MSAKFTFCHALFAQLVIEFGPPPVGVHLLAARHDGRTNHYGRKLARKTSTSSSSSDSGSNNGESDDEPMPDIPVCPDPNLNIDLSQAVSAYARGDSTIVYSEQDKSFGSDVLLELSPPQCGDMHTMINFDVKSLVTSPMVEYASILIHVIEGSDLSGATFLHTPVSDWSEDSVTWRNAPEYDKVIGSLNTIKNGMVSLRYHFLLCCHL